METINSLSARSLQYYVISKRWSSDLQFFKFETGFLRRLLDEHFFSLNDKVGIEKVRQINNELLRLDVDKNQVERSLEYQLTHIELMAEDVIPENASELAVKQIELEYRMANIMGEYREVKKNIFSLIGKALDENKLSYNYPNYN